MDICEEIYKKLQQRFSLDFSVVVNTTESGVIITVTPDNSQNKLFKVAMEYRNGIRIVICMEPEAHAAPFVKALGNSEITKKQLFSSLGKQLLDNGASLKVIINDSDINIEDINSWPRDWYRFKIVLTYFAEDIIANERRVYLQHANIWLFPFMEMILSLMTIKKSTAEDLFLLGEEEGRSFDIVTTKYERNHKNRSICVDKYGYKCQICSFDFEKKYGVIGKRFIHVHHIVPLSEMGDAYVINPLRDLIPVCPNCHAMLHRTTPPLTPEELKRLIKLE